MSTGLYIFLYVVGITLAAAAGYGVAAVRTRTAMARRVDEARLEAAEARARVESERRAAAEAARAQAEALRAEFRAVAAETTRSEGARLRSEHLDRLNDLLTPLGKEIEDFRDRFVSSNAAMDRYVRSLVEQTAAVGREADALARALKSNNKAQGNWGEAVLANLLEVSGLTVGRDFFVQHHTRDAEGRELIPDVVVAFPGERRVVIDSKVSLTAFTDYANATDEAERAAALKRHVASVRAHVKELSAKDYASAVEGAIGYVLMFIPNEAAYIAAVTADARLTADAYRAHVILLNPTNLLMALQLAYNLWQSELQGRSVREIYDAADRLYKKFCGFADNFVRIGRGIDQLNQTYVRAEKQLTSGRGSIVAQLEGWKKKGLTPSAELPPRLRPEEDDDAPALPERPDGSDATDTPC